MTSKIKVDNISDQNDNNIINESGDVITVGASGDTVAVAGNVVKSNAYQASDGGVIISQSGTTITIGASGDTVSLASGASQSGFGRSGTVNWQTSIKTANFDATSGEGYFCDTSSGAFTLTLPSSPSVGDIVAVKDYANSFDSNALTIDRNGSNIGGQAENVAVVDEGMSVTLVYADATKGWLVVNDGVQSSATVSQFVTATGGNTTITCGNFKTHIFTGPGTFSVSCAGNSTGSNSVEYLVVAGGGGGGSIRGGGGGAGGFRIRSEAPGCNSPLNAPANLSITASSFPITVGGGGAGNGPIGGTPSSQASKGSNSIFSTIT